MVAAFRAVDRADFVPDASRRDVYSDRPIPILEGQTTSQPSLIARMIDAAEIAPGDAVLEIGTGFGYQTALLAALAREVVSIDRHESLVKAARAHLARAGIENATVIAGDGFAGYAAKAPFDAIVVSAGAPELPDAFRAQLRDAGRLVIPLQSGRGDDVYVFTKRGDDLHRERLLTPARFVPLVRDP